jgi:23S rRNA pseudouridine1911/1915/1917 synthase
MINIEDSIIYEDSDMIICNKHAGWLSQSDRSFDVDMVSALCNYRVAKGEPPYIAILNRLDRPVSGLVLFAKTKKSTAMLTGQMQDNHINKYYYAVICGKPDEKSGTFVDYLVKDAKSNTSRAVGTSKEGKRAELSYEVIAEKKLEEQTYCLVKIHLLTGRHHQIRVQFASRKLPLYGDTKYNPQFSQKQGYVNIALCAYRLEVRGKSFEIQPQGEGFSLFHE